MASWHTILMAAPPPGRDLRFSVDLPVGSKIVEWSSDGEGVQVLAFCPVGAPIAAHPFLFVPNGQQTETLLGRKVGDVWPVVIPTPMGGRVAVVAQDLPWPEPARLILSGAN